MFFVMLSVAHSPHFSRSNVVSLKPATAPPTVLAVSTTTTTTTTQPAPTTQPDPPAPASAQPSYKNSPPATEPTPPETPIEPAVEECANLGVVDTIHCFFGSAGDKATRVADCESSLDPSAISPGGANWGLFQINTVHKSDFEQFTGQPWNSGVLSAYWNTQYAFKLSSGGSKWGSWACGGA